MRIETGHPVTADVQPVNAKSVRFVSDDGRTIFEVYCLPDGAGIEVRSVDMYKVGDRVFDNKLFVQPRYENCINVRTLAYEVTK